MNIMKKIRNIMMVFFCLCISFLPRNVQAAEDFYINSLDIKMNVYEDGLLSITETYDLYFQSPRRGFYRTIPSSYKMTWDVDGKTVTKNYFFPIRNINCYETESKIKTSKKGTVIRLGDPDRVVKGSQKYTISYDVQTRDLGLDGMQMLYWNLIGDGFDTYIKNLTFTIDMPKSFDTSQVFTYTGSYGSTNSDIEISVEGNTIVGKNLKRINSNEAVTLKVNVDKDYFTFPSTQNHFIAILILSCCILVFAIICYWKYGRDDEVFVSVEFSAPDGLSSAEIGYIIDGMADDKDVFSLIIDWARRGYIIIHEEKEALSLEKIRDLDDSCPYHERSFFTCIFDKGNIVTEQDLQSMNIKMGLGSAKGNIQKYFRNDQRRIFTKISNSLQILMVPFMILPTILFTLDANYAYYEMLTFTTTELISNIIFIITAILWVILYRKRHVITKKTFMISQIVCILVSSICILVTVFCLNRMYNSLFLSIAYGIITILLLYIMLHMQKRTQQGNRWLGQILGLKEFIETCEKEKLEMLVKETPSAFFDILPYAYVLGVSEVWANKFEKIAMQCPDWYHTDRRMDAFSTSLWWLHFSSSFSTISNIMYHNPNSHSGVGGGSISGGSVGGGFSGGGFGGGGGGSW